MLFKLSSVFFLLQSPLLLPNDIVHSCNLMMTPSSESNCPPHFGLILSLGSREFNYNTMRIEGHITKILYRFRVNYARIIKVHTHR